MTRLDTLLSPTEVRLRCSEMLALCAHDELPHFVLSSDRLAEAITRVLAVSRASYPTGDIPFHSRWRHFEIADRDLWSILAAERGLSDPAERLRVRFDLAVISVLLDAGAGPDWRYRDDPTGRIFARSEGLAVASLRMFARGLFSRSGHDLAANGSRLETLTLADLQDGFQISASNPLTGLEGRLELLRNLATAMSKASHIYGRADDTRPGALADRLVAEARDGILPAERILRLLLETLGSIWPDGLIMGGRALGDVGRHPALHRTDDTDGLIPFHKLSQWLSYSLIEPMQEFGLTVTDVDALTGLPEYRNGGLFLDTGVLVPRDPAAWTVTHRVDSPFVVEWRALTVALLDRVADEVRAKLGKTRQTLPLACVLQGGTWSAGRQIALEKRRDGAPPLSLELTGTVF